MASGVANLKNRKIKMKMIFEECIYKREKVNVFSCMKYSSVAEEGETVIFFIYFGMFTYHINL